MVWTFKANLLGPTGPIGPQGLPGVNAVANDAATAGYISTGGTSATKTALESRLTSAVGGLRWVSFGDSLTSTAGGGAPYSGWTLQASMLSNGQINELVNAGITGNNASQMLARINTDVLAYTPNLVTVWVGTNDITQSRVLTDFQSDVTNIIAQLKAAGALPVLFTIPPRADTTKYTEIVAWNAWLRSFARTQHISLVDVYSVLVDPATGAYKAGYDVGDGLHMSPIAHNAVAQKFVAVMGPRLPAGDIMRPQYNLDANNLITNGLLLTNVDASPSIPDHWLVAGPTTGITETIVTDTDFNGGTAWQVAAVNPAGLRQFLQSASAGWSVGDVLLFVCKAKVVSATGVSTTKGLRVNANFFGATSPTQVLTEYLSLAGLSGVISRRFTVPASTTTVQIAFLFDIDATASETVRVGEVGIFNLTQLGIA